MPPRRIDTDEIVRRYRAGEPMRAIARAVGCSDTAVFKRLVELGLHKPREAGRRGTLHGVTLEPSGPNHRPAKRRCLSCGEMFASDGPHHRRCDSCRTKLDVAIRAGRDRIGDGYRVAINGASLPSGGRSGSYR